MGKAFQPYIHKFPSKTYTAGQTDALPLRDIPATFNGKFVHVLKIIFDVVMTPTFGGGNEPTVRGTNAIVEKLEIYDGKDLRLSGVGGFNLLRAVERLCHGKVRLPDPDTNTASATARYFRRVWHAGPPQFAGAPSDFMIPASMLNGGEIRFEYGSLAAIGTSKGGAGDPTGVTGTIQAYAVCALSDKIRIPPLFEVRTKAITGNDDLIAGQAAHAFLGLINDAHYGAFAAGDLGQIEVDAGFGTFIKCKAEALAASFADDFGVGDFGGFTGEPSAASDDNFKNVNRTSGTALLAGDNDLQPVLWSPPDCRINKLHVSRSSLNVKWNGTQTTGTQAIIGRILPQDDQALGVQYARVVGRDGKPPTEMKADTLSKEEYRGGMPHYMPVKAR